ncbi:MAG TPA: hypothetical protein VIV60_32210 [Polyangiaceae bacterium]
MNRRAAISRVVLAVASMLLTTAIVQATVGASTSPSRIFLFYRAAPTCPDRAAFIQLLFRRMALDSLTEEPAWGRPIFVNLEVDGDEYIGQMEFDDGTGSSVVRTVRASRCEEVASAMALVTALAVEPLVDAPSSPSEAQDNMPNNGDRVPVGPQPIRPAPAIPQPPAPAATKISISGHVAVASMPPTPKTLRTYTHEASLGLSLVNGLVGPGIAMGPALEWGIGIRPTILRISATWLEDRWTIFTNQRSALSRFRLVVGAAQLCAGKSLFASTTVAGAVCLGPELGQYYAEGTPNPATQGKGNDYGMLWAAATVNLHVHVEDDGLFLDFSPSLRLPLVRRDFIAERPASDIHKIPAVAFGADLAIGVAFR